jgi:hypothetical protein
MCQNLCLFQNLKTSRTETSFATAYFAIHSKEVRFPLVVAFQEPAGKSLRREPVMPPFQGEKRQKVITQHSGDEKRGESVTTSPLYAWP